MLATEGASVLGLQADFSLLPHFPEQGAIASPGFADELNLPGGFSHVSASCLQAWRGSDPFVLMLTASLGDKPTFKLNHFLEEKAFIILANWRTMCHQFSLFSSILTFIKLEDS